jgi:hypothetical protein
MALAHLKKWLHLVSQSQSRFWRSQSPAKGALNQDGQINDINQKYEQQKKEINDKDKKY